MQRSLIRRLVPPLASRLRLRSYCSFSDVEPVHMTENCVRKMKELEASESSEDRKMLRLSVETGGCSGFQYAFNLDERISSDDRVFERNGIKLVVDNISYDFVKGATVDYVEELIRSAFVVTQAYL